MDRSNDEYVRETVAIIANKWTLPVLYTLRDGAKRYSEINKVLSDMTQKVLTETLRKMEENKLVTRAVYPTKPPQVEYNLTESGNALLGIIILLVDWTKGHFQRLEAVAEVCEESYDKGEAEN